MNVDFGKDYELIDTGGFEKLERFGAYMLRRPEPQAIWPKSLPDAFWNKASAYFKLREGGQDDNGERGQWITRRDMPGQWNMAFQHRDMQLAFRLGMTSFKHVGIFPEQACNWRFIYDTLCPENKQVQDSHDCVLNLFAYTGGASLAAKAAGADVTHLDSVRQVIHWANENQELSHLNNIRWIVEDALLYAQREARRGKKYQGIILDPPAYGRGPKGEKWILGESIVPLMDACRQLLDPQRGFIILNLYSMGFSPSVAANLLEYYFPYAKGRVEQGELSMSDRQGRVLPLSIYARFRNNF